MAGALQTADRLIPVNTESHQLTSSVPGAGAPPGVHWAQEVTTHGGSRGLYFFILYCITLKTSSYLSLATLLTE